MKRVFILFGAIVLLAFQLACQSEAQTRDIAMDDTDARSSAELFIRIIKTTEAQDKGILEMWRRGEGARFHLDKRFDICTWSGDATP